MRVELSHTIQGFLRTLTRRRRLILALAIAVVVLVPTAVWASHNASDVPNDDWAHADVEWMYAKQLTNGCAVGMYCPDGNLTRREMAAFTHREQLNLGTRSAANFFGTVAVPAEVNTHLGSVFIDVPVGGGEVQAFGSFFDLVTVYDHLGIFWLEAATSPGGECDLDGVISLLQVHGTFETSGFGSGNATGFFIALPGTKRVDLCGWTTDATQMQASLLLNWISAGPDGADIPAPAGGIGIDNAAAFSTLKSHLESLAADKLNS